jgi:hypothetical protein
VIVTFKLLQFLFPFLRMGRRESPRSESEGLSSAQLARVASRREKGPHRAIAQAKHAPRENGEFNFIDLGITIKPKAGSMIIFESDSFTSVNGIKRGGRKIEVSMPMYRADKDIELV